MNPRKVTGTLACAFALAFGFQLSQPAKAWNQGCITQCTSERIACVRAAQDPAAAADCYNAWSQCIAELCGNGN